MRILVFHGYLLHGTGSNVYNARLAPALVRAGHEVHLLCQERRPLELDWVDAAGDWDGGELALRTRRNPARATVYRPDVGGVLPVYVADAYEGVQARPFPDLSDAELERYIDANAAAVRDVCSRVHVDVALANHLVMGPLVLARALEGTGVSYAVTVHGSALEYTVKPHPRFLAHAREGLGRAVGVLVGSRHTAESLWAALEDPAVREKTRLGPPGVDVATFAPREPAAARAGLADLAARLAREAKAVSRTDRRRESVARATNLRLDIGEGSAVAAEDAPAGDAFAREAGEAARALAGLDPERERLVVFVGKLIASKGLELLLAAWPLVVREQPDAHLVIVGFGAWRSGLEALAAELAAGDLDAARVRRAEDGRELPQLAAFLDGLEGVARADYAAAARPALTERVTWTGRLDHPELAELLPAAEALVAPSTFPEAFGMVAAEGAACGALPVVARHSGLAEVSDTLAAHMPEPARRWLSFAVGPGAVTELASCLTGWLGAPPELREQVRDAIVAVTGERWSWDGVARTVLAATRGRLDELPRP